MKHPDNTVPTLELWLNAYWRYLEPERLLLGDAPTLKQFLSIVAIPPSKIHSFKCIYLPVQTGAVRLMVTTETSYPLVAVQPSALQQILNDKYPQFLEGDFNVLS